MLLKLAFAWLLASIASHLAHGYGVKVNYEAEPGPFFAPQGPVPFEPFWDTAIEPYPLGGEPNGFTVNNYEIYTGKGYDTPYRGYPGAYPVGYDRPFYNGGYFPGYFSRSYDYGYPNAGYITRGYDFGLPRGYSRGYDLGFGFERYGRRRGFDGYGFGRRFY